ncbi:MAG: tetrathionate reductase family octaheme c-type cytochrome [Ignavibacteriales bacterium]|nr:tetrathionate reductase family octaheme c-type cytochrome [Ignavibacteriales bacterium]
MKKIVVSLIIIGLVIISAITVLSSKETDQTNLMLLKEKYSKKITPSVDHTKFAALRKNFISPQQVTEACNSCHNERAKEVIQSNHWNWEEPTYIKGRGIVYLGKKNAINNFCIGTEGNELSCAKCHIGYGMNSSKTFDFNNQNNVDCLVCHDNTETYAKAQEKGGAPEPTLDFANIAQHVGNPKRSNCGVCHFFGGGGNNVKHGDLEQSMFDPTKSIDIHMGIDGTNLQCVDCHKTEHHIISGQLYSLASNNRNRATCEECHTETPHDDAILNKHTLKIACQTCHIPVYAKVNATKTDWNWSTAGKLKDGQPFEEDDAEGNHTYLSIKGNFKWGKNLKPDYIWFNGTAEHYLLGDKVADTTKPLVMNTLNGSYRDVDSKIIPVKIHRAQLPFDPVNKILIQPKLYAEKKGEGALWKDFNWQTASAVGMKEVNLPFSGKVSFIQTEMYWPINHMVSSKENTVKCTECHTRDNSRLAGLKDFYMPARDFSSVIETTGKGVLVLSFLVIFFHGGFRIYSSRKLKKRG